MVVDLKDIWLIFGGEEQSFTVVCIYWNLFCSLKPIICGETVQDACCLRFELLEKN